MNEMLSNSHRTEDILTNPANEGVTASKIAPMTNVIELSIIARRRPYLSTRKPAILKEK